ncbi:hypothetical protein Q3G72_025359 [Acer saccharum]|nr:hypothetical protein Q3G72_025359 [Acer saccharum]
MLLEWIVNSLRWIESGTELDFMDQSFLSTGQLTDHSYPSSAYDSSTAPTARVISVRNRRRRRRSLPLPCDVRGQKKTACQWELYQTAAGESHIIGRGQIDGSTTGRVEATLAAKGLPIGLNPPTGLTSHLSHSSDSPAQWPMKEIRMVRKNKNERKDESIRLIGRRSRHRPS